MKYIFAKLSQKHTKTKLWRSFFLKQWVTFSGWEVSPTENRPVSRHAVYYIHRLGPGWCSGELLQTGLAVTSFTSPRHILQHTTGRHMGRNRYIQQYLLQDNIDNVSVCLMWMWSNTGNTHGSFSKPRPTWDGRLDRGRNWVVTGFTRL